MTRSSWIWYWMGVTDHSPSCRRPRARRSGRKTAESEPARTPGRKAGSIGGSASAGRVDGNRGRKGPVAKGCQMPVGGRLMVESEHTAGLAPTQGRREVEPSSVHGKPQANALDQGFLESPVPVEAQTPPGIVPDFREIAALTGTEDGKQPSGQVEPPVVRFDVDSDSPMWRHCDQTVVAAMADIEAYGRDPPPDKSVGLAVPLGPKGQVGIVAIERGAQQRAQRGPAEHKLPSGTGQDQPRGPVLLGGIKQPGGRPFAPAVRRKIDQNHFDGTEGSRGSPPGTGLMTRGYRLPGAVAERHV